MQKYFFITVWLIFSCELAVADTVNLDEIKQIARTGAIDLATHLIELQQDQLKDKPDEWMSWEHQRLLFYVEGKRWKKIVERTQSIPDIVADDFRFWLMTQRVEALIALRDGATARATLRELIWQKPTEKQQVNLRYWRRLVIQSYLADGYASDAQVASLRLQQDYGSEEQDIMQQARIALLNNRPAEAITLLAPHAKKTEYMALALLAELRSEQRPADKILHSTLTLIHDKSIGEEVKANLWLVATQAASKAGNTATAANAMEHALVARKDINIPKSVASIDSEQLWVAYSDYATSTGNKEQLLVGQDQQWLDAADKIRLKHPVGARSMYAFVILNAKSTEIRNTAAEKFAESIEKRRQGKQLLQVLFETSRYFKTTSDIPEPIRHSLVDLALAQSDIDRASELMATIKKPPQGADQFMWKLRRARILVLGNQTKVGAEAVQSLLNETTEFEPEQLDRLLQVVFDLQTAGEHESAYDLFAATMPHVKDEKVQRELYYWMADSRKAQERYAEAARLYLKSAQHPDPENMDPWAQTARYHAADSLAKAGMYEDAGKIFEHLLRVTDDPTRRANLKTQLQKLWAMQ